MRLWSLSMKMQSDWSAQSSRESTYSKWRFPLGIILAKRRRLQSLGRNSESLFTGVVDALTGEVATDTRRAAKPGYRDLPDQS